MEITAKLELTLPATEMDKVQDRFFELGEQVRALCNEAGVEGTVLVMLDGMVEKH